MFCNHQHKKVTINMSGISCVKCSSVGMLQETVIEKAEESTTVPQYSLIVTLRLWNNEYLHQPITYPENLCKPITILVTNRKWTRSNMSINFGLELLVRFANDFQISLRDNIIIRQYWDGILAQYILSFLAIMDRLYIWEWWFANSPVYIGGQCLKMMLCNFHKMIINITRLKYYRICLEEHVCISFPVSSKIFYQINLCFDNWAHILQMS